MTATISSASKVISVGTFILNTALATSLSYLWGLINGIQIISYLPYFNTMVPANVISFYEFINDMQTFNFIPFSLDNAMDSIGITAGEYDDKKLRLL